MFSIRPSPQIPIRYPLGPPPFTGKNCSTNILTVKAKETILTSKGTTSIPIAIRKAAGLHSGSRILWEFADGEIRARRKESRVTQAQSHIAKFAGSWDGHCSGAELLQRTRP